jgi:cytochrome c peroxidase
MHNRDRRAISWLASVIGIVAVWAGVGLARSGPKTTEGPVAVRPPRGLPLFEIPDDNLLTAAKVALGKQLYFDKRLSVDNTISCASCHDPAKGFSNGEAIASGIHGRRGARNSPTVLNVAYHSFQFWDGRASTLEAQVIGPILNPIEMGMPSEQALEAKLNGIAGYKEQFQAVFGTAATAENMARAIAAFERTILAAEAPYDRFRAGDKVALSDSAQRGLKLFFGKAHCAACHAGPNFTDNAFHNIGIGMNNQHPDRGRQAISKLLGDRGTFKTPSLRDTSRTGPYMHDGSLKTLEEVVDWYNKGGAKNPQLDEEIYPLNLTDREKQDVLTFLIEGLTSEAYPDIKPPELPN